MESPMKGVERLSAELKQERLRGDMLCQDKNRTRLDTEELKKAVSELKYALQVSKEDAEELTKELSETVEKLQALQGEHDALKDELAVKAEQYQDWLSSSAETSHFIESLQEALQDKEDQLRSLHIQVETLTAVSATKDAHIASLTKDLKEIRKAQKETEQSKLDTFRALNDQEALNEELQMQLQLNDVAGSGQLLSQEASEELRAQLEESLATSAALNEQLVEMNNRISQKAQAERRLSEALQTTTADNQRLSSELAALTARNALLESNITVETSARLAAGQHAETVLRNRRFLDDQLADLKEAYHISQTARGQLEVDLANTREELEALLGQYQEQDQLVQQLSVKAAAADQRADCTAEIDSLRTQLNQLRRQMIKRDMEEQAGVLPPKVIIDREQAGRAMYEGIIQDLRNELDRSAARYEELRRQFDVVNHRASTVDQLTQDLAIYKELAALNSQESQTIALEATRAEERKAMTAHLQQTMRHELADAQAALQSMAADNKRAKDEINMLREKVKVFHSDKLLADKRSTELYASNAQAEASLEEMRQQYDMLSIELDRAKRVIHENTFALNDMQRQSQELSRLRDEHEKLTKHMQSTRSSRVLEDQEAQQEGQRAAQQRDVYKAELDNLKAASRIRAADMDKLLQENHALSDQLQQAIEDKESYRVALQEEEAHRVDVQMATLKRDLAESVNEWNDLQAEKTVKDSVIQQLQADYAKEKERVGLLGKQVNLLEQQGKYAAQQLAIYRSIDIYHSSLNAELRSYREEKEVSRTTPLPMHPPAAPSCHAFEPSRSTRRLSLEEMEDDPSLPPVRLEGDAVSEIAEEVHQGDHEEEKRQALLQQKSARKAAREAQLRSQLMAEEKARRSVSAGASGSIRPKPSSSPPLPPATISPLKALINSSKALKVSQSTATVLPRHSHSNGSAFASVSSSSASHLHRSVGINGTHGNGGAAALLSAYGTQSASSVTRARMQLEKARRLIAM